MRILHQTGPDKPEWKELATTNGGRATVRVRYPPRVASPDDLAAGQLKAGGPVDTRDYVSLGFKDVP